MTLCGYGWRCCAASAAKTPRTSPSYPAGPWPICSDDAARLRSDRERRLAAQRAEEEAHREKARALARERQLDELAREETAAWSRVDTLIATRKPAEYDAALGALRPHRQVHLDHLPPRRDELGSLLKTSSAWGFTSLPRSGSL
ncbi:MAG: hypothetical protein ACRDTF_19630 [Pseudonocardiaceae bacterium]